MKNNMLKATNVMSEVNTVEGLYRYKKIAGMNDNVISVVQVANRTLDFHVHQNSDEMFWVLEGKFQLETAEGLTEVKQGEFIIVPKGTKHRPVVTQLCKFLMVEREGTLNKQNSGELYEE